MINTCVLKCQSSCKVYWLSTHSELMNCIDHLPSLDGVPPVSHTHWNGLTNRYILIKNGWGNGFSGLKVFQEVKGW